MSVTSCSSPKTRGARLARALAFGACIASAQVPGCAAFGGGGPSTVAQGKYYSTGNPQYDEYFIALYQLQVEMADAPRLPDGERQSLAQALGLSPETATEGVAQRLREEALKLSRSGVRMRLEPHASPAQPGSASATIVASYRPKEPAPAALLAQIESSASNLLRTESEMQAAQVRLGKLEVVTINLDADVPKVFAEAHVGTQSEVKKNLADALKLITLMKARGDDVRAACEQLLAAVAKAVNTDDGSLSVPPVEPEKPEPRKPDAKKPTPAPARAKPRPAGPTPASRAPAPAQKPKPPPVKGPPNDDDAPAKPAAPSKPAPPPRDFEP